jgi:hypothetical protein
MATISTINAELDALASGSTVDWDKILIATQAKIAEAVLNGGVVTYNVNGRSVTRSVSELREILKMAESRAASRGGGIIAQLGEFD